MRRLALALIALLLAHPALAVPINVRAWYAEGQVFVVWEMNAALATPVAPTRIYSSPAVQPTTATMTLAGEMFFPEYTGSRIQQLAPAATLLVPTPGGGTYRLAANEGVFVYTPHAAGNLFFAVVDGVNNVVVPANSAATPFLYDPVNDPVRPHAQFTTITPGGNPSIGYVLWADGRSDPMDQRPDFPVLGNELRNGVPHVFAVTEPLNPLPPGPRPCAFVLHGGNDNYALFRPGQPERSNLSLPIADGIVVSPDDALFYQDQTALVLDNTDWFGYDGDLQPFDPNPRTDPPATAVIVNYTQRRVHWILDWLLGATSPYLVDPARVALIGHSMGARGALHVARLHARKFCATVAYDPALDLDQPPAPGQVSPLRGNWLMNLDTNLSYPGVGVLGTHDVMTATTPLDSTERDIPVTRVFVGKRDEQGAAAWGPAIRAVIDGMNNSSLGYMILWDEREHAIPEWSLETNDATDTHPGPWPDIGQWVAPVRTFRSSCQYLVDTYRNDRSYPGFYDSDDDAIAPGRQPDPGPGDPDLGAPWGTWSGYFDWDGSTVVDAPERWECTVFATGLSPVSVDNCPDTTITTTLVPRRTHAFLPAAATSMIWTSTDTGTGGVLQSGTVTALADGVVRVVGLAVPRDPKRVRVRIAPASALSAPGRGALALRLDAPRPNPLRGRVALHYALSRPGPVRLEVFSLAGQRVAVLADGFTGAGEHDAAWDARVPAGLYFARLTSPEGRVSRRMSVLR